MLKKISNLGKPLDKSEMKAINGSYYNTCGYTITGGLVSCPPWTLCVGGKCIYVIL